jgi:hypothetical protein
VNFPAQKATRKAQPHWLVVVVALSFLMAVVWVLVVDVPKIGADNFGGPRWAWTVVTVVPTTLALVVGFGKQEREA